MALRVTLAGHVGIEADGLAVNDGDLGRPARLALAYLVCERHRPVPRDELADVVWGDRVPRSWEQLLRGVASKLREFLGAAGLDPRLVVSSAFGAYQLHLPGGVTVDVEDASEALAAAENALRCGDPDRAFVAASATAAVAGRQFLPGTSGVWVERRQAELREVRLRALDLIAAAEEARGRWSGAVTAAEETIGLEPFRESAYLRLMAAHAGAGNRGEALRAYERCRLVLAEELGVNPSATTEATYLALLGDEPLTPPPAPEAVAALPLPPALTAVPGAFLVGRDEQSERLGVAFKRAITGVRQAVLVAGEPGVGKTALVAALARSAHTQGARVLYGRCDEGLGVAYQPFAEALGHYVTHCPGGELKAHAATYGGELSRLVPELARRLPELTPPLVSDPDADRYRLFEAVAALLRSASQLAPVVIVVDDLHWAANATLLLLRHLLSDAHPAAVLVIGTYRHSEVVGSHPLAAMLADLRREPEGMTRVRLDGLDADGVAAFVQAAEGTRLGDEDVALARALHAHTAGNPFFVGQLLAHLAETGAVYRRQGQWSFYADADGLAVPEGVKEVVARRLQRLGEAANRSLVLASVIGTEFALDLLEAVTDQPDDDVLDALEEAGSGRLVEEVGHGRYRFAHALVRDTIYASLTTTRKGRLHRRIGDALESLPGQGEVSRLPALAHHFAEAAAAGAALKAADYALAAARQAVAQAAWEDAAALLDRGLECLEAHEPPDLERRCDLLLLLAETWTRFYDPPRAAAASARAADVARTLGSPERLGWAAHWHLRAANSAGQWDRHAAGRMSEEAGVAGMLSEEALVALGDTLPGLRARLLAIRAFLASFRGESGETSNATAWEALALARRSGDPGALGIALSVCCNLRRGSPYPYEHLALAEELVSAAPPDGWDGWREGHEQRAMARLALGDRGGFKADVDACERLGAERRYWYYRWVGGVFQATLALLDGRFGEAATLAARARDANPKYNFARQLFARQLFRVHLERGDTVNAALVAAQLVSDWPDNSMHRGMLALARIDLGEADEVRSELVRLAPIVGGSVVGLLDADHRGKKPNERWPVTLAYWAEVTASLGDMERAESLYEAFSPYRDQMVIGGKGEGCMGAADRYLGMLAATMGRWEDAVTHYEAALALEAGLTSPPLVARTCSWYGRMLLDRGSPGDRERAEVVLGDALTTAERLGMAGLAAKVEALIRRP